MRDAARWRRLLAGAWLGALLTVALIATPAPFATLAAADAGRVAARVLASEAYLSLALGIVLVLLERQRDSRGSGPQFGAGLMLALGAIFCTVAGYFGLQPLMADARAGAGRLSFGQLHAASFAFYAVKVGLVAALAWRASATPAPSSSN
jgi:Domain of unknown function (DUF4149)